MSNISSSNSEVDFWEFVNCAQCHLLFCTDTGSPPVPFWLTECGHVVCNNHLNTDQSCAQCGAQGIQLMPLQREMEAPMSEWFRCVPTALDSIAIAARFQLETIASLARHYKSKYTQQRGLLNRLRDEYKTLKKAVEELRAENDQLRQYGEYEAASSNVPNMNGKRRMLDSHRHQSGARTNSSPRTVITPLGPNRLTLPPDHQQPSFSSNRASHSDDVSGFHDEGEGRYPRPSERPGSRRFTEQYAYMPPETPQSKALPPPVLSHAQTAPLRQALARQTQAHGGPPVQAHTSMPPPPLPVGRDARDQFRPGPSASAQLSQAQQTRESVSDRMLPPPTPQFQRSSTLQQRGSYRPPQTPQLQTIGPNSSRLFAPPTPVRPSGNISTNRFLLQQPPQPPQQHQGTAPSSGSLQRFSSSSVNNPGPSASGGPNLRAPSRTASVAMSGGQRFPFVPGA